MPIAVIEFDRLWLDDPPQRRAADLRGIAATTTSPDASAVTRVVAQPASHEAGNCPLQVAFARVRNERERDIANDEV
jgi:hypothetical protein